MHTFQANSRRCKQIQKQQRNWVISVWKVCVRCQECNDCDLGSQQCNVINPGIRQRHRVVHARNSGRIDGTENYDILLKSLQQNSPHFTVIHQYQKYTTFNFSRLFRNRLTSVSLIPEHASAYHPNAYRGRCKAKFTSLNFVKCSIRRSQQWFHYCLIIAFTVRAVKFGHSLHFKLCVSIKVSISVRDKITHESESPNNNYISIQLTTQRNHTYNIVSDRSRAQIQGYQPMIPLRTKF